MSRGVLKYGNRVYKYCDTGWNEALGPQGLSKEVWGLGLKAESFRRLPFKVVLYVVLAGVLGSVLVLYYCSL